MNIKIKTVDITFSLLCNLDRIAISTVSSKIFAIKYPDSRTNIALMKTATIPKIRFFNFLHENKNSSIAIKTNTIGYTKP